LDGRFSCWRILFYENNLFGLRTFIRNMTVKNADVIGDSTGLADVDTAQLLPFRKIIRRLSGKI
jgi:hypothetical protein